MGLFSSETTFDPMSRYTPEQRKALEGLMSLATTGSGLGINLGEAYGGSLGDYQTTGVENQGLAKLMELVSGNNPYLNKAANVYQGFADTTFNPDDPSSGFAAFSRQVARATGKADDVLNREAAITGSRFGTGIQQRKQDLAAQQSDSLQTELSRLFESAQNRKLAGASGLAGLAGQQQSATQMALQLGGLERDLKNQEAQANYSEYLRQRNEKLGQIDLADKITQVGLAPVTTKAPSVFAKLFGEINPIMGSYNAAKYGYTQNQTSISDVVKGLTSLVTGGSFQSSGGSGNSNLDNLLKILSTK